MRNSSFVIEVRYGLGKCRFFNGLPFDRAFTTQDEAKAKHYKTAGGAYRASLKFPKHLADKLYVREVRVCEP